jgi:hypothetical protein
MAGEAGMRDPQGCDQMKQAFLDEFKVWWPFAQEKLTSQGWVKFTVSLEAKGRDSYFVQGSLESSEKVRSGDAS